MAKHYHEVSKEARNIFTEVAIVGRRTLDLFCDGFQLALKDVHKNWRSLDQRERKIVFEKVQEVAKELIVDKRDGGGVENGLSLGTFHGYVCKVKKSLIYSVPIFIAEKATTQELQKAQYYVKEALADEPGTLLEKMSKAYEWVKSEQVKEKEAFQQQFASSAIATSRNDTPFTLPNPDDYEDVDSLTLLESGIQSIVAWLETRSMRPHIEKDLPAAKMLRNVYGDLSLYCRNLEEKVA